MLLVYDPKNPFPDTPRLIPFFGQPVDFRGVDMEGQDVVLLNDLRIFPRDFGDFKRCRRLIYVCSDAEWRLTTQIYQAVDGKPNICICNSPNPGYRWTRVFEQWIQVQLNWASYEEYNVPKDRDWVYWGTRRKGRDFTPVEWMDLSCSPAALRNHDTWKGKYVGHLSMRELARYRGTLYIEDKKQHGNSGLANRFYEALGAGIACYFHESCEANAVRELGHEVRRFIGLGTNPVEDARVQRALFACDFKERLRLNLGRVIEEISRGRT